MESSKSLRGTINWSMIIVTILSISMIGSLWVVQEYLSISAELLKQKNDYIAAKKTEIKIEVDRVIAYIDYKRTTTEQQLKDSIKTRVYEANAIANGIYNSYRGLRSDKEIQKMIKAALRSLIFNNGRGYFFIYDMQGNNILLPFSPHLEGKNLWNFKDSKGKYSVQRTAKMIREKGEGFQRWHWYKPGEKELMSEKIGFSKQFEPYDWWIGSGEYIEDFEKDIQKETLEWINTIRFGQDGYIFVYDFNGTILAHFQKETIGHNVLQDTTDPYGIKIVGELIRMSQPEGGGFFEYEGKIRPSTGLRAQKISHSQSVQDWQWTVGAGVYVDSINTVIEAERKNLIKKITEDILNIFIIFIFSLVIIGIILRYISQKTTDHLIVFTNFFEQAATKSIKIRDDAVHFSEFKLLAQSANQMMADRTRAEEAQRKTARMLRLVMDCIPVRVFWKDLNSVYVGANQVFADDAGFASPDDLIGKTDHDFLYSTQAELYRQDDSEVMNSGEPKLFYEERKDRPDSLTNWLLTSKVPIRDDQGNIIGLLGVYQDITERKQLETQLQQSQKMEAIGTLTGGVAHDFNNMLSAILGHTELAKMRCSPTESIMSNLDVIQDAALRSADLVKQLLTFARKQVIAPTVLDVNNMSAAVLKLLSRVIGEDIDLSWLPGSVLWKIKMDSSQVDQLLVNLCVNARDAITDVGNIIIETKNMTFDLAYCKVHRGFIPGEYVMLTVSDNGCGMSKDTQEHIFEPFYTTKTMGKGTGLGLATVYGIVKQNNGFINVYSEPDQGTTFRVYLPRYIGEDMFHTAEITADMPKGKGETVLLVEDESMIREVAQTMLKDLGYEVLVADTPGEAIKLAEKYAGKIQLLITDVIMPEMNGRDLTNLIHDIIPEVACLFISGYTANVIAHHGVLDDDVYFLPKPFSMNDLALKVHQTLG